MAVNIGPRIGIEGEDKFRKQIMDIVQTTKTLNAEMKAVTTSFGANATAQDKAYAKANVLNKQIANEGKQLAELKKGLDESKKAFGDNDRKTQEWQQAVNESQARLNKLNNELTVTEQEMNRGKMGTFRRSG